MNEIGDPRGLAADEDLDRNMVPTFPTPFLEEPT
jgi:hypothetical protein